MKKSVSLLFVDKGKCSYQTAGVRIAMTIQEPKLEAKNAQQTNARRTPSCLRTVLANHALISLTSQKIRKDAWLIDADQTRN